MVFKEQMEHPFETFGFQKQVKSVLTEEEDTNVSHEEETIEKINDDQNSQGIITIIRGVQ